MLIVVVIMSAVQALARELVFVPAAPGTVSVIDASTNAVDAILLTNRADFKGLSAFAMAPDATHAYVVSQDGANTLTRLDLLTGELSDQVAVGGTAAVVQLIISQSAALAYVLTDLPNVLVVDLGMRQVVRTLSFKQPSRLALSPDETHLYVTATDLTGQGVLLDVETATYTVVNSIPLASAGLAIAPNGALGFVFQGRNLVAVELQTFTSAGSVSVGAVVQDTVFSPDSLLAFVAAQGPATVSIVDATALTLTAQISIPDNRLANDFSPWRLTRSGNGTRADVLQPDACDVAVVDTEARQVIGTIPIEAASFDIAAGTAPDPSPTPSPAVALPSSTSESSRTCAYVSVPSGQNISIIDSITQRVTGTIPMPSPGSLVMNTAGTQIYATTTTNFGASGAIAVIDTTSNTTSEVIFCGDEPFFLALGPGSTNVYAPLRSECYDLAVIDPVRGQFENRVNIGGAGEVGILSDGSRLYVPQSHAQRVAVLDAATQALVTTVPFPDEYVLHVAVTLDSRLVYVSADGLSHPDQHRYAAIDSATNMVVASIPMAEASNGAVAAPGGQLLYVLLALASGAGSIAVIDTSAQAVITSVPLEGYPSQIAVSPDGNQIYVTLTNVPHTGSGAQPPNDVEVVDAASYAMTALIPLSGEPGGLALGAVSGDCTAPVTPAFTATSTATSTYTQTATPTPPPTPTVTPTLRPSITETVAPTSTPSPTNSPTRSPTSAAEPTTTAPPTATATSARTPSSTATTALPHESGSGCNMEPSPHSPVSALWLVAALGFAVRKRRSNSLRGMTPNPRLCGRSLLPPLTVIMAMLMFQGVAPGIEIGRTRTGNVVHLNAGGQPILPTPPSSGSVRSGSAVSAPPPTPEVRSAPGGGRMIILDDRFRNDSTAHLGSDGVRVECQPEPAVRAPR